jgi:hypothetical protein
MKIISIKSAIELLNKLKLPNDSQTYRGQGKHYLPLVPSIARLSSDCLRYWESWDFLLRTILTNFQKRSLLFVDSKPANQLEWLILAQHHGLPTNILDWTSNPLKALFFAIENPVDDKYDGAVWHLDPNSFYEDEEGLLNKNKQDLRNIDALECYFPSQIHPRVIAQESCFTLFPLHKTLKPILPINSKYYKNDIRSLVKYIIPKEYKNNCRSELKNLGISHMSVFPDLEGIAKSIRRELDASW